MCFKIIKDGNSSIAEYALLSGRTQAVVIAMLLYDLGKHAQAGVPSHQEEAVRTAIVFLARRLTANQQEGADNGTQPQFLLAQLDPKRLSLCAWAISKLQRLADLQPLSKAILQHTLESSIFEKFNWVNWALVLYGVAAAGVTCDDSKELRQLFSLAASRLCQTIGQPTEQPLPQDLSNILYAAAKAHAQDSAWQQCVKLVAGGYATGNTMVGALPQAWSNMLWACKELQIYDAAFIAAASEAMVQQPEPCNSQVLANALYALAGLGWYEPAIYEAFLAAFIRKVRGMESQNICNVLWACCLAQHVRLLWSGSLHLL
jgi:hypothetical protein